MRFQAYLLAAGRGRRAGGPKAWLERDGRPLLARQLEFLLTRCAPPDVAASIQEPWLERCRALCPDAAWVPVDPDAKPLGALLSLLARKPLAAWAFLHHVDMPVWEAELFDALSRSVPEAERSGADAVVPAHRGLRGHPVLLSPKTGPALAALEPAKDRLDAWLRGRKVLAVDVPFACVLENWNEL